MNNWLLIGGIVVLGGLFLWSDGRLLNVFQGRRRASTPALAPAPAPAPLPVAPRDFDPYTYDYGYGSGTIPGIQGHRGRRRY